MSKKSRNNEHEERHQAPVTGHHTPFPKKGQRRLRLDAARKGVQLIGPWAWLRKKEGKR